MARYGDLDELKLKVQRYMIPNDGCGLVSIEQAERWFLKLIDETTTADVVPKSEVERWRRNLEAVFEERTEEKTEVAREIFEEIDRMCIDLFGNFNHTRFIELKKKYTEEKQ